MDDSYVKCKKYEHYNFEWVICGIYVVIRTLYDWLKEKLFGIKDEQKAELKKARLENSGFNLVQTQNLNQNITLLTYKKP